MPDSPTSVRQPQRPAWALFSSPFGPAFAEVVEHEEWYRQFPQGPPQLGTSPLEWRALRRRPGDIPAVLRSGRQDSATLLDSPLASLMTAGPSAFRDDLALASPIQLAELMERMQETAMRGQAPATAIRQPSRAAGLLVSPAADAFREELVTLASWQNDASFSGRVQLYAPLYLSSECTNQCSYCGFAAKRRVARRTLDERETEREARALAASGIRHVLLLCGEAPKKFGVQQLLRAVQVVAPHFETVSLEVFPLEAEDYRRLRLAGCSSVTLYQETYCPTVYQRVHLGGRKRDPLFRLGAPERILQSGFPKVGLGALLGLSDWRFETLALTLHASALLQQFPNAQLAFSFPRLRAHSEPSERVGKSIARKHATNDGIERNSGFPEALLPPTPKWGRKDCSTIALGHSAGDAERGGPLLPVGDEELIHMMTVLRLVFPRAELVLSTREPRELRDFLAPRLVNRLSASSSTAPGGYTARSEPGALSSSRQFTVSDERSAGEVRARLAELGLKLTN